MLYLKYRLLHRKIASGFFRHHESDVRNNMFEYQVQVGHSLLRCINVHSLQGCFFASYLLGLTLLFTRL